MGGGIGLAGHAAIRIVTERSKLAMPETRIGFTPDVGGTWLLAHAPGRLGEYLGLTGARDGCLGRDLRRLRRPLRPRPTNLEALRDALETRADPSSPTELVLLFDETPEPSAPERARAWIDDAFAADTVAEIVERLRARARAPRHPPPPTCSASSRRPASPSRSPSVRRSRELPGLRDALEQEYGLVMWFATTQPDLAEGIRAQVIDKDRSPRWQPATIADLPPDAAASALAFVPATPLWG